MNLYATKLMTKVLEILAGVFPIFKIPYGGVKNSDNGKVTEKK